MKIDEDMTGFVRHITFRSVIMRRQNSVTVIIPNSAILNKTVTNWNYSRTFFAFDDIMLIVDYAADPSYVKNEIHKVLDAHPKLLKNPTPIVRLQDFADNGFQFLIRGFLSPDKINDQHDIASDVRLELVKMLRANDFHDKLERYALEMQQYLQVKHFERKDVELLEGHYYFLENLLSLAKQHPGINESRVYSRRGDN